MKLDEQWRFVGPDSERGDWNMAADEALLEHVSARPPTLRLYSWREPCISIGCLQQVSDVDQEACRRAGIPLVRRASGGTAVLHEGTVAFSLILPPGHRLAVSDIVESYRLLAPAGKLALQKLGIEAEAVRLDDAQRGRPIGLGSAACFASLSPFELVVGSRKLVGNSQLRRRGGILHHAVTHLDFCPARFASLLKTRSAEEASQLTSFLDSRIASLSEVRGQPVSVDEAAEAMRSAVTESFGVKLMPEALSRSERESARRLIAEKYGNPDWTYRR